MLTFITASLVLIAIPGPDQALITRNALAGGRCRGLLTMAGGALGLSVHACAAALGISALVATSATAFTILKLAGAAYLVWMGIATLRAARRTAKEDRAAAQAAPQAVPVTPRGFKWIGQGFASNALNPKIALFFLTFLPQFMSGHQATTTQAFLLSAIFALLYLAWFSAYVVLVDRIGATLRRPRVRARIEQLTGTLLIGFAIRLAAQHNG
jgi:threonine/homoserine/homoserine lactone efflux protein